MTLAELGWANPIVDRLIPDEKQYMTYSYATFKTPIFGDPE